MQLAHAAEQLAGGAHVWASADVRTPPAWVRRECARRAGAAPQEWPRILGATEEWLLWRQAAREAARSLPFLDTGVLAESLQRASARAAEYGVTLAPAAPGSESALLYEARRLFEARCREMNAASVSTLLSRLPRAEGHTPLLCGFDAVPPGLAALATARAATPGHTPAGIPAVAPRRIRVPDAQSQMEAIAAWCQERLREEPDARLLVMLPGPAGARERLAALIRASLDPGAALAGGAVRSLVALEGDEPFGSLPLPQQALASLTVLAGAEIDVESARGWLTAPYWESPGPAPRAALALLLRQRVAASVNLRALLGALQLAPRALQPAARELDARLRQGAGRLGEGSASPRRWSERVDAALASLGWPGPLAPESGPYWMRLQWRELLEQFGELDTTTGALSRTAALELLRELALRTPYRAANEDAPVTLSPMLADPVVIYDGVWVGSLSADVLPQPVSPNPFLPLRAQLEAGLPEASAAGRRAQAQGWLAAWRLAATELVLCVPERDGDLELLPSPYLSRLAPQPAAARSVWLPLLLHRDGCTETFEDARGAAFNALTPLPSGTRALTLQNACAFRAYAELRLGAAAPEQAEPGVAMDQRGLLLHGALQRLWERLRDSQALAALGEAALEALIAECVARAAQALLSEAHGRRRRRVPEGQLDLFAALSPALEREAARARALIRRLCELERTRAPFTVEATEHVTELSLGGGRLRMRLDRVDRLAAGRAVLDYKSGRPGSPDWFGERPTHPQLLAYLAALGTDVVALATVNLTAREVRFTGVAAAGDLLPRVRALPAAAEAASADWNAQQRSWTALIERLIRDFLAGEARVDPAPGACDFCHLTDLCRIGAHLAPEAAPSWDEADG